MKAHADSLRTEIQNRSAELRRITLRSKRAISADLIGNYRSTFRGSGLNFSELREYAPGDDIKHIDWRSSARSGKTFVKSYEEERQLTVMLAIDTSYSTAAGIGGSIHHRGLLFSSLVATLAAANSDLCGLMLFSDTVNLFLQPSNKRSQSQQIIRALGESEAHSQTDINNALDHFLAHFHKRTILFLLSDFYAPKFDDSLKRTARKHDTILVMPELKLEQFLPDRGIVQVRDPETGEQSLIDAGHKRTRAQFEAQLTKRHQELSLLAERNKCELLVLGDDPLLPLTQLMSRRHKRGI